MHQKFTMVVPMEYTISNNRESAVWLRQKVKAGMSALTREHAAQLAPMGCATIFVGITKRTRGLYDPVNLTDTFKACVDELVRMGIVDDDNYTKVLGPWCYHAGVDSRLKPGTMRATVTLTPYSDIPF